MNSGKLMVPDWSTSYFANASIAAACACSAVGSPAACGAFAVEEHEAHVASVACALHRGVRDEEATVEDVAEL